MFQLDGYFGQLIISVIIINMEPGHLTVADYKIYRYHLYSIQINCMKMDVSTYIICWSIYGQLLHRYHRICIL